MFKNKWAYEVALETEGNMIIGWCSYDTSFSSTNFVGSSSGTYGISTETNQSENLVTTTWETGDLITSTIDFEAKKIVFFRNREEVGEIEIEVG